MSFPSGTIVKPRKHRYVIEKVNSWQGVLTIHEMAKLLDISYNNLAYYIRLYDLPYKVVRNPVDKKDNGISNKFS